MKQHPLSPAMLAMHVAVMGKTGSGKTYAAKGAVEGLLATGAQVVVLDPTSAWWGLRLKPDGKTPAYARVVVMGGRRGDIPLSPDPAQAEAVAKVIHEQGLSMVLDTGSMTVGERTRWAGRFGEALYRLAEGRPIHLVIDEAHVFAPQGSVPSPDVGVMVHAFNELASGGRSRGLRLIVITQRPAKLHKDTLTSCDTLAALRVIAPQDRKAIEEWVEGCGDKVKAREVLDSLASLKRGEGWVWCPELDPTPHRVQFPAIATYDSSATPTGDGRRDVHMGEVDTAALGKLIASAGDQIKADDPKALRARIKELETAAAKTVPAGPSAEECAAAFSRGYAEAQTADQEHLAAVRAGVVTTLSMIEARTGNAIQELSGIAHCIEAIKLRLDSPNRGGLPAPTGTTKTPTPPALTKGPRNGIQQASTGEGFVGNLTERILAAVDYMLSTRKAIPASDQVAALLGYHPRTKSFTNALGAAVSAGLLVRGAAGLELTPKGQAETTPIPRESIEQLLALHLGGRRRAIFERLLQSPASNDALAAGFNVHPRTKAYTNDVGALVGLGLVERVRGELRVAEWIGGAA